MSERIIDGVTHVWSIHDNAWVTLDYWKWVNGRVSGDSHGERTDMDSHGRENLIRQYTERVLHNPTEAQYEEAVAGLLEAWQADVQDVHERAYSDGAEGVMA